MKIEQIICPSCGGKIKGDLNLKSVFCPYCGSQLYVDQEKNEITINLNQNINKTETKRIINDAEIIKAKKIGSKEKYEAFDNVGRYIAIIITTIAVIIYLLLS